MLAKLVGCSMSSPPFLDICLQLTDPWMITSKQFDVVTQPSILSIPFPPVVDGYFLPDEPEVGLSPSCHVFLGMPRIFFQIQVLLA